MNRDHAWSPRRRWDPGASRRRPGIAAVVRIERWDVRRDGPLSEAALRRKIRALGSDASSRPYAAAAATAAQSDSHERIQAVLEGLLKVTIDGEAAILTAGDVVFVPRGSMRRIEAVGAFSSACLDAVYLS